MNKIVLPVLIILTLCACGVKPGDVDPPEEVQTKEFPRVYPDIGTDPPPYVRPTGH